MTQPLTQVEIAQHFFDACKAELKSLKPGNVHVYADGHRMTVEMFENSARAAAPCIAMRGESVGKRIESAVAHSVANVGTNTNLGIMLLCAPLAAAVERATGPLRVDLANVLSELTVDDARATYRAIARANPAGLGTVEAADITVPPEITLRAAMQLARGHDRIANAYATDYADVFDFALPALTTARLSAQTPERAVTTLHMCLLAQFPDTHIARKFGLKAAETVQDEAFRLEPHYLPAVGDESFKALQAYDADLKQRGLNPGTTADFVVATLFAEKLLTANRGVKRVK